MLIASYLNHTFTTIELLVQVLYGAFIILLLLFGWDLLERYIKADKRMRNDAAYMIFFIMGVAMLGYGIYLFPAFVNYFLKNDLIEEGLNVLWLVPLQYGLLLLIIVPIGYICLLILLKTRKIFAYIIGLLGALTIIYMFILVFVSANNPGMTDMLRVSSPLILPVLLLIGIFAIVDFLGIIYILVVQLAPQKEVRNRVLLGTVGIVIAGIGGFIEVRMKSPDEWWYVYGTLIELIGFITMRYFFLSIRSYDEFAWKSGMKEIHVIIAETGISLFYQSFADLKLTDLHGDIRVTATIEEDESRPNSDLVAGGLVGIKGMLSEISGDRGKLENIEIGEKSLIFKQGKVVLCLLLADENLGVYHSMLQELTERIESDHPDLENFNGDTRKIHIGPIVEEVFDIKK
ncbi:MAG: hypothetical protein ACTSYI_10765 [Promethearchaeota archaeon]